MHISDFDYSLPSDAIAQHPPDIRGQSRLLRLERASGAAEHHYYYNLPDLLLPGDLVILNDTKVIRARLQATGDNKDREFLLLERHGKTFDHHRWTVLYRGKVKPGEEYHIGEHMICIETVNKDGTAEISSSSDLLKLSEQYGSVPLPPYMKRTATPEDIQRYQTEFAQEPGSVAAPTASLNFTKQVQQKLEARGCKIAYLTLHVGIGTFLPIRSEDVEKHVMHSEYFEIPKETYRTIQETKEAGGRIIAVGTTVARTLEYAHMQLADGSPRELVGEADIFIYPGYGFKVVDGLLTNFHAPKSTVLMLTAAFAGWQHLKAAYEVAIEKQYRLLSYGDSMLIL